MPYREVLDNMGIDIDSSLCPRCGTEVEYSEHTLVTCACANSLWKEALKWWNVRNVLLNSVEQNLNLEDTFCDGLQLGRNQISNLVVLSLSHVETSKSNSI